MNSLTTDSGALDLQVERQDRQRRARNTRTLATGLAVVSATMALPLFLAGVDARVVVVTAGASLALAGCALLTTKTTGDGAALLLNGLLPLVLFAGVAANRQIGPGPAFVGFSLFVAAATLPLRGVVVSGIAGALLVVAMGYVARDERQIAVPPGAAMVYGLVLCFITTMLSVVQAINSRHALALLVAREQQAHAAEARARESESRYRLITDNMSDVIALLDERGRFLYASPSVERIFGTSPEELLRDRPLDKMHRDDLPRAVADFTEALSRGKARGSYRCRDARGRERWIESVYDAIHGEEGALVAIAARDVTENRALSFQLQQAQKLDALGRMAAAVAHDFNNLLMIIQSAITLARWDGADSADARSALEDGERATVSAAALTKRLLAFSRNSEIATEVIETEKVLMDLKDLLRRAVGPTIELDVRIGADLPPILAAPVQLEQVLLNLAINARDAMEGGGKLEITARARTLQEGEESGCRAGNWLHIDVADTGSGMSEEVMARVFEPFFTTKAAGQGTGLGLSTCYGIVRQLSGRIVVATELGQGTTFTLLLPRAPAVVDPETRLSPSLA